MKWNAFIFTNFTWNQLQKSLIYFHEFFREIKFKETCKTWFHDFFCAQPSVEIADILSHWKKNSSNQLFSDFFSKSIAFTKFLQKKVWEKISAISILCCENNIKWSKLFNLISRIFPWNQIQGKVAKLDLTIFPWKQLQIKVVYITWCHDFLHVKNFNEKFMFFPWN